MEGAIGERLSSEFKVFPDNDVALAAHIYDDNSKNMLESLYTQYIHISMNYNFPIMITTPTRRSNKDRIHRSRYSEKIIADNVSFLEKIKNKFSSQIYIGGLMGCKGDAYIGNEGLSEEDAFEFHSWQAELFKDLNIDFLYAGIMPSLTEAMGMAKAMESTRIPYIISFMIRKDGRLLDGTTINEAILAIDNITRTNPICYMTNCVHPDVVYEALSRDFNKTDLVKARFKGIQANTSSLVPEILDNSLKSITCNPDDLALSMERLYECYNFKIFGGCCGTTDRHMDEIAKRLNRIR